jgi:hypothetical protein
LRRALPANFVDELADGLHTSYGDHLAHATLTDFGHRGHHRLLAGPTSLVLLLAIVASTGRVLLACTS